MDDDARRSWYQSFLPSNLTDSGEPRIVHTYKTLFQGFAAWLTEAELDAMSKKPGFSSWYPEIILHPATLTKLELVANSGRMIHDMNKVDVVG